MPVIGLVISYPYVDAIAHDEVKKIMKKVEKILNKAK